MHVVAPSPASLEAMGPERPRPRPRRQTGGTVWVLPSFTKPSAGAVFGKLRGLAYKIAHRLGGSNSAWSLPVNSGRRGFAGDCAAVGGSPTLPGSPAT